MMSPDVRKEIGFAKEINKRRLEVKIDESEHTAFFKDFFDGCKWIKGENHKEIKERVADLLLKELSGEGAVVVRKAEKPKFTPIKKAESADNKVIDPLHEHIYEKAEVVEPTCKESGYTVYRCECGEEKKSDFTPRRSEHDFRFAERKEPTCTKEGYIKYECAYCDETKTEPLPAKGHDYKLTETKEPTCIENGHKIFRCSVCGDTKVESIKKIEHTYGDWVVTKNPTCEGEGEETKQCSFCGKTETRPVKAKGHNYGKWVISREPTCTDKGEKVRVCTVCGKKDHAEVEPKGHEFSAWQNTADGKTQERICKHCGFSEIEETKKYKKKLIKEYKKEGFIIKHNVLVKYKGYNNKVIIPDGIVKIGKFVFEGRKELESVVISEGVQEIGEFAFYRCVGLKEIVVPKSVIKINKMAFYGCIQLKNINASKFVSIQIEEEIQESLQGGIDNYYELIENNKTSKKI